MESKEITSNMADPTIYTDGACSSNGKTSAKAGYGVWFDSFNSISIPDISERVHGAQTNQRAELMAAVSGIKAVLFAGYKHVTLYTDSTYVLEGATDWVNGWMEKDFHNNRKSPISNQDLWKEILNLKKSITVTYIKVKGHSGDMGNELADELARSGYDKELVHLLFVIEPDISKDFSFRILFGYGNFVCYVRIVSNAQL